MRNWLLTTAVAALAVVGCNKSPEGGSAGTADSFKISAPTMATTIKQDNTETVKLSLDRGKDFKKDVKLSVTAPDKVKAELSKDTVKASDPADFTIKLIVDKGAALGDYKVKVTGTPDGGGAATAVDFTLKIADKN